MKYTVSELGVTDQSSFVYFKQQNLKLSLILPGNSVRIVRGDISEINSRRSLGVKNPVKDIETFLTNVSINLVRLKGISQTWSCYH